MLQLSEELRRRGHAIIHLGPANQEGWLGARFREAGFSTATYTQKRPLDPMCLGGIVRALYEHHIDLVHSHEFFMCVYGAAASRILRIGHLTTMHGNQSMTKVLRRRAALRWAFRRSDAAVAVSRATKVQLDEDLGLDPTVLTLVPNGIPVRPGDRQKLRAELGLAEGELLVLSVGSLIPRKGHKTVLEAMKILKNEGFERPFRFAVAGRGELKESLVQWANELGVGSQFTLLGVRNDIPDVQAAADIFVMPSLWEGLPLAVLEAMLAGSAIIATSASGIPEAITDNEHGLLVQPEDPQALAASLRRLLSDGGERARLGAAAKARGESVFTIGKMTDAYEALYRTVP